MNLNAPKALLVAYILIHHIFLSAAYADDAATTTVVNELNALYNKTDGCADGKADYYCSGIILTGQRFTKDRTTPWYFTSNKLPGSFSYIRSDITPSKGYSLYFTAITGYILTPLDEVKNKNQFAYQPQCFFAWDGYTHGSDDCNGTDTSSGMCSNEGIVTLNQFLDKYVDAHFEPGTAGSKQCSFSMAADEFKVAMEVEKYLYRLHPEIGYYSGDKDPYYNEFLITPWTAGQVPENQVPIKAFFIAINDGGLYNNENNVDADYPDPTAAVFNIADAYKQATNLDIPVVTIDIAKLQAGAANVFAPAVRPNR